RTRSATARSRRRRFSRMVVSSARSSASVRATNSPPTGTSRTDSGTSSSAPASVSPGASGKASVVLVARSNPTSRRGTTGGASPSTASTWAADGATLAAKVASAATAATTPGTRRVGRRPGASRRGSGCARGRPWGVGEGTMRSSESGIHHGGWGTRVRAPTARPRGGSMSDRVTINVEGGVADVRLNRPDKLNAVDGAMFQALVEAGEQLKADRSVRAIVLSGEGRGFCAGLDFSSFQSMAGGAERSSDSNRVSAGRVLDRGDRITSLGQQAAYTWTEQPAPVIAAVHGPALG